MKDINSTKAELNSITNKIQTEYDNLVAVRRLREDVSDDMEKILMLMQAKQYGDVTAVVEGQFKLSVEIYFIIFLAKNVGGISRHVDLDPKLQIQNCKDTVVNLSLTMFLRTRN